jgi:hypothetical protein
MRTEGLLGATETLLFCGFLQFMKRDAGQMALVCGLES